MFNFLLQQMDQNIPNNNIKKVVADEISYYDFLYHITLEKIRYRIIIPEFYVIQICKHGRSVVIG